jgi:hypothetical protein
LQSRRIWHGNWDCADQIPNRVPTGWPFTPDLVLARRATNPRAGARVKVCVCATGSTAFAPHAQPRHGATASQSCPRDWHPCPLALDL